MHLKTPRRRLPFFFVGDEVFIDLTHNSGEPLAVEPEQILGFLTKADPASIMIARRLTPQERDVIKRELLDGQVDGCARLIPSAETRWKGPRSRTRRR